MVEALAHAWYALDEYMAFECLDDSLYGQGYAIFEVRKKRPLATLDDDGFFVSGSYMACSDEYYWH